MIPPNWQLRLLVNFELLMLLNQVKEGVTILAWVIDPEYQQEIGLLLLHKGGKEGYVLNTRDLLGCLLVLPCPVIKDDGKPWQPFHGVLLMAQIV